MTAPRLAATDFGGPRDAELLLLGPSLGTSAAALWSSAAERLTENLRVVGWDLPGHGRSPAAPFRMPDLAAGVLALADEIAPRAAFHYAGNSIGGAVGLQLALDAPERLSSATLLCTGAAIGRPEDWAVRAATVRASGTTAVVDACVQRWFAPGFIDRQPELVAALVDALLVTDNESYAQACEALAEFDVTALLDRIATPVLAVAGSADAATPPESLRRIASGVSHGRLVVLDDVGHLAPAEAPDATANLIREHLTVRDPVYAAGMSVRRSVLGDEHVDRAIAGSTGLTADFQELITRYAWGSIWTRDGLDRRSRSIVTLTALVARGHHEELAMHLRAARRNGLSNDEIKEVLLQTAVYCGVPDANTAFRIAAQVLADHDDPEDPR
ncbi:4-carboxymuconolactone decarboxylase [Mycolicibacter hiberniae]|uniref:3-oxoadipate enol-lactonase n=1 Tax=Mycolicibacter hiberniae TaxID=29314 RepID=A0A7I7X238_9MYCO|nr:4-carboxymuconolactone decarboxylase [Mycolicibacter hiberniae]MCV7087985.1 4-carboxymuconolactone decarboxylase [Mycolicibacter hiberniae]ORV66214.1 3-oxoadipate enol-lactonase [Mycolicibacter hiberniae]BBZ23724.1 3-oxoadipate enol-lactonase [Mycolicibacter hiberniae]